MIKLYDQDPNIDKGVYRNGGNMRCLYSNKPNDKRTFIPDNFKNEPMKHLIQSCEWSNSDFKPIPSKASPPVSPISSDNEEVIEEVVEEEVKEENPVNIELDENSDDDMPEYKPKTIQKKKVDYNELQKIMEAISIDKFSSEYDTWMRVGMALSNITDGNSIGKTLYEDFSKVYACNLSYAMLYYSEGKYEMVGSSEEADYIVCDYDNDIKEKCTGEIVYEVKRSGAVINRVRKVL